MLSVMNQHVQLNYFGRPSLASFVVKLATWLSLLQADAMHTSLEVVDSETTFSKLV
jgi:hypothetical protein